MHTSACFEVANKCKISKFARCKFNDFSRIFKYFICFHALSRALKFLFRIQAFSRISQACYEPCLLYVDSEHRCSWRLFQMTGAATWKLRLPSVAVLSTARSLRPAEWRRAEPVTTTTRPLPYFSCSSGQNHDRISEVHNTNATREKSHGHR